MCRVVTCLVLPSSCELHFLSSSATWFVLLLFVFFVLLAAAELVFLLTSKCNSNYKWKFNSEVLSLFCFECYCVFVTKEIHLSAMSR